jgi:MGT family glycosyltransferase
VSRFLFAVPPFTGHVNPTIAVGAKLASRGHEVAWVGHAEVAALLPPGARLLPAGDALTPAVLNEMRQRWLNLRAFAALKVLWEDVLIPINRAMVDGVHRAVDAFAPHVVIADQQTLAGAVVALTRGVPWATSATNFAEFGRPYAAMPQVEQWVDTLLADFAVEAGMTAEAAARVDLRFSDRLVLAYSIRELVGPVAVDCDPVFVGPAIGPRGVQPAFPWEWLDAGEDRRARVLVSLGTHNGDAGARFFRVLLDATEELAGRLQIILVTPEGTVVPDRVGDHVLVTERVPQLEVLEQVDAVVSHAGPNTVAESLTAGRPLVLAPIRDDQPSVAERVAALGAGIRVRFGRVQPAELRDAITAVLETPSYREAAHRIAAAFTQAGGAAAAADHLEKML